MNCFDTMKNRYKEICSCIAQRFFDIAYEKQLKFEEICSYFSDETSKNLYISEIIYCMLIKFLKGEMASGWAGQMTYQEWNRFCVKAHEAKHLEHLVVYPEAKAMLDYFATTTYVLEQYRYYDKVTIAKNDICIDCGGCLGDTAIWMVKQGAKKVYSFEIDKKNIECMNKSFEKMNIDNIQVVKKAVSDKDGDKLYYLPHPTNVGAGKIMFQKKLGSYQIDVCTIDNFCENNSVKPNFIKMDIEGAEMQALKGSKNIIQRYKPKLAICIYHSWEDRFDIPMFIHSIVPEYKMYLKKSSPTCETVLFCTM